MENKPLVSILIPVYNQEDLITRALDSIPEREDIEVIVVDDCSTDNTWNIVSNYDRIPIKAIRNETNLKVGMTRNKLLDAASGKYVYGLDSDDYLLTEDFNNFLDKFTYDEDFIHVCFQVNSGEVLNQAGDYCAFFTSFIKTSFINEYSIRCRDTWRAEDWYFREDCYKHFPLRRITNKVIYHYNYPREGSITNIHEETKDE